MNKIESFKIDYSPHLIPTTSSMPDQTKGVITNSGAVLTIKPGKVKSSQPSKPTGIPPKKLK